MLKVPKKVINTTVAPARRKDADLYDIVVCQLDWRIMCTRKGCETHKDVTPKARCDFSSEAWNAGPTCIGDLTACPHELPKQTADKIQATCKVTPWPQPPAWNATDLLKLDDSSDLGACKKLADALAEYF